MRKNFVERNGMEPKSTQHKTGLVPASSIAFEDQFNHDEADEIPSTSSGGLTTTVRIRSVPDMKVDVLFAVGVSQPIP